MKRRRKSIEERMRIAQLGKTSRSRRRRNPNKCGICRRMNGRHRQSCAYRASP